jgi:hypothetical protein
VIAEGQVRPGETEQLPTTKLDPLHRAIVRAVAYADVFDMPLPRSRVRAALDLPVTAAAVHEALSQPSWASGLLDVGPDDVTLAGRGDLRPGAERRRAASRRRWRAARRAGRLIAALPFVRYVAVSGSLAVDSADAGADIDLFLVTADGRLWLARRLVVGIVRLAALARVPLCPNYLVAESAIELDDRSVFVAHELAQIVPVGGEPGHAALVGRNAWAAAFLPNAFEPAAAGPGVVPVMPRPGRARRIAEALLRVSLFDRLERWELARMRRHLSGGADAAEARFDAERCKGHLVPNGRRALEAYADRLDALGVSS